MRDSWRAGIPDKEQTRLDTTGLYRFSRNPVCLGFDCMYFGVLLYCNPLTAVLTAYVVVMLHLQLLQEERHLTAAFGNAYREYRRHVFRYPGRR